MNKVVPAGGDRHRALVETPLTLVTTNVGFLHYQRTSNTCSTRETWQYTFVTTFPLSTSVTLIGYYYNITEITLQNER